MYTLLVKNECRHSRMLTVFWQAYLPIANVARIMRKCIPDDAKISKKAKECVQV